MGFPRSLVVEKMQTVNYSPAWQALSVHAQQLGKKTIADLLQADDKRAENFLHCSVEGLQANFSRHLINDETVKLLLALAEQQQLKEWRQRLFAGALVNNTEKRPALHMALRQFNRDFLVDGVSVRSDVQDSLEKFLHFAESIRNKTIKGATGKAFQHIIHLGIGGSDLGPKMVLDALAAWKHPEINVHFVSNVDSWHLSEALRQCDPASTLVIIASKSFTTEETLLNANSVRAWLQTTLTKEQADQHLVGVTVNVKAAMAACVPATQIFPFWDWVGGRFSLWSSVGLPVAIAVGAQHFRELLAGAAAMDEHFLKADLAENIPVWMALTGLWCRNFMNISALALLPYTQGLQHLPFWLQQLDMESNGKSVNRDGVAIDYDTAPLVFGESGTNGQHSFYQWMHQGTTKVASDIIMIDEPCGFVADLHHEKHHRVLSAHGLAQAEAFTFGRNASQTVESMKKSGLAEEEILRLLPFRIFDGNRPLTLLRLKRLDAYHLGLLLAAYEHKIFVQGVLWEINSFDQFGVELGKELAKNILQQA